MGFDPKPVVASGEDRQTTTTPKTTIRPAPALLRREFGGACLGLALGATLGWPGRSRAAAHLPEPLSPALRRIHDGRKLRVGMCPGQAPFILEGGDMDMLLRLTAPDAPTPVRALGGAGRLVAGLDVDLAVYAAQSLGVELEIALTDKFEDVFLPLGKGEVDVVLGGVSRTLLRAAALSFSSPYLISGLEIFTKEPARFATLKGVDAPAVRVAALEGTTGETFARRYLPTAHLSLFSHFADLFRALEAKQVDACVADGLLGKDAMLRHLVTGTLSSVENRRLTSESIAFVTRQGDPDFTEFLSLVVHELKVSGRFHQLARRYNPWLRTER